MTPEQAAAYVMAQAACALIEMASMQAQDRHWERQGAVSTYTDADYLALIEKYGIHHNAVSTTFMGAIR